MRLLAVFLFLVSVSALAAPCLPGTLQDYFGLVPAGCEAGDVVLNNFQIAPGQAIATPIDPAVIQVVPGGTQLVPALTFVLNQAVGGGEVFEALIRFTASAGILAGASISLDSPSATGDAAVTGVLDVCADGSFPGMEPAGCDGTPLAAIAAATAGSLDQGFVSTPISSFFDVFVDLTVDGGLNGSAVLPSATVSITAVPEPVTGLLAAVALGFIGVLRIRANPNPLPGGQHEAIAEYSRPRTGGVDGRDSRILGQSPRSSHHFTRSQGRHHRRLRVSQLRRRHA